MFPSPSSALLDLENPHCPNNLTDTHFQNPMVPQTLVISWTSRGMFCRTWAGPEWGWEHPSTMHAFSCVRTLKQTVLFHCALKRHSCRMAQRCQVRSNAQHCGHAAGWFICPWPFQKPTHGPIFLSQLLHKCLLLSAYWLQEEGSKRGSERCKKWRTIWMTDLQDQLQQWPEAGVPS